MTPERYRQVVALFEAACALPPAEREALLAARCAEDAGLRRAVEAMLAQDERRSLLRTEGGAAPGLLAAQALQAGAPAPVPEWLGGYRILGVLGAGAMGTVYRAEQQHPRREVALKTVHWWTLSPQTVERFRFEAQALAQLQHPGIPQVYEVSEDAEHLSFAMELVEGPSLAEHVASLGRDVPAVLALVADIADAVHHAHLRGLVHRDLKPDNIRVTAGGQPKVLDFGISLPVDASGASAHVREVSGTLAYMSPEQLWPEGGIDIRADVYALGVIAYELLCGERPFHLQGLSFEQARAHLREAPVVPLGERRPGLRGDVSLIVARAMARRREARYGSAAELADDLRRHLRHEPVHAHPGGSLYRLGRLVRRHRVAVGAGTLAFLALVAGGGTSFVLFRQAEAARREEARLRAEAEAARDHARREGAKSAATVDFLSQLLLEASPNRALGRTVTVREALDKAAERLAAGALKEQPAVEASVRLTLAQAYRSLGLEELTYQQVLEAARLARDGRLEGQHEAAEPLLALADVKQARGLFAEARDAIARALATERAQHPEAHPDVARALFIAGQIGRESGDLAAGERSFREAITMGRALVQAGRFPEGEVASTLNQLAHLLTTQGRYDEAEHLFREALAVDTRLEGADHPEVATDLHNLAWLMHERERGGDARGLLARVLAIRLRTLGKGHPRVGLAKVLLASIALDEGALEEAERVLAEGMANLRAAYPPGHPVIVRNRSTEVRLHLARGRLAQAQEAAEAVLALHRERYGEAHWATAEASAWLGRVLLARGERARALPLLERARDVLLRQLGPGARATREATAALGTASAAAVP